jgi:hypothetical protein
MMNPMEFDMTEFLRDRYWAMLSLDMDKVRAFMQKYGEVPPDNDDTLLIAVHKARESMTDISQEERKASREWLRAHGYKTLRW